MGQTNCKSEPCKQEPIPIRDPMRYDFSLSVDGLREWCEGDSLSHMTWSHKDPVLGLQIDIDVGTNGSVSQKEELCEQISRVCPLCKST